jgi:hypothetical protein
MGESSHQIGFLRQGMRKQDTFHVLAYTLDRQQLCQLIRSVTAHIARKLRIEEHQREVESIRLSRGDFEAMRHLRDFNILQKLEVRGVSQEVGDLPLAPADDLAGPGIDGAELVTVQKHGDS